MALRMRKDIKKSSYYVWFLGAQESKGLRGAEYIHPVVKSLVQRERDVEPFKVTLQVSHKGLKIIQNIPHSNNAKPGSAKPSKPEVIKHLIPHHAVTCVLRDEDIVSCILLLYNPVTKCPVHVHAYRCDSVETAEVLSAQLQTLIERPENQKKLGEIETRLKAKGLLVPRPGPTVARRVHSGGGGSDGRSTESSGGSSSERLSGVGGIATLYDSLAAELREKLGTEGKSGPLLLPPRDYDTVHRQKGNLAAVDMRRCLNSNIVGVNVNRIIEETGGPSGSPGKSAGNTSVPGQAGRAAGSSGGSSGIGSDHAPSPDVQDRESNPRYLENPSSSDEEWNEQPSEDSLFLVQPTAGGRSCSSSSWRGPGADLSLPRARRVHSSGIESPSSPSSPVANISGTPPDLQAFRRRRPAEERQRSPSPSSSSNNNNNKKGSSGPLSPRDRFKDAKEKFLLLERERLEEQERQLRSRRAAEPPIAPAVLPSAARDRGNAYQRRGSWSRSRDSEDELEDRPQRASYYGVHSPTSRDDFGTPEPEVPVEEDEDVFGYSPMRRVARREPDVRRHRAQVPVYKVQRYRMPQDEEIVPDRRQRYRREQDFSPERRERFLSPSRNPRPQPRSQQDVDIPSRYNRAHNNAPRSHVVLSKQASFSEDSTPEIPLERYRSPIRNPVPAPRHGSPEQQRRLPRANPDKKRRSMFEVLEEERRRSSNELAKEFKRRSYQDEYQELSEAERFPGLDRDTARLQHHNMKKPGPPPDVVTSSRYRHSYAEPHHVIPHPVPSHHHHHEMLHRTNSSVSSGRVGIAAVHPY